MALHLPKPYWILMTVLFVTQNGMVPHGCVFCTGLSGTMAGPDHCGRDAAPPRAEAMPAGMLAITLVSYLIIRKITAGRWVGFTVTAVYVPAAASRSMANSLLSPG